MEIVAGFCCTGFNLIYRNISLCCVSGTELLSVCLSATEMCLLREQPSRVRPQCTIRGGCELCQHLIWTPFPITHGLGSSVSASTALLSVFANSVTNDNDTAKRFFRFLFYQLNKWAWCSLSCCHLLLTWLTKCDIGCGEHWHYHCGLVLYIVLVLSYH